jgi:recombination protein RecT
MSNGQLVPLNQGIKNVLTTLKAREKQLKSALPKYITVERWIGIVSRSIQNNPKLLQCTEKSLYSCIFQAAQLGLECDGVMHEAYLIPYKVKGVEVVTLIPGYPGYLKLVRNSGQLASIATAAVWKKDLFEFEYGTDSYLKHIPSPDPPEENEQPIAFYCVARLKDGSKQFEVMWPWQVNRIRDNSSAYKNAVAYKRTDTPWIEHYDEQGRKTALIRVCKMLPKSTEMARAIRMEEQANAGEPQEFDFMDIVAEDISEANEPAKEGKQLAAPLTKLDALANADKAKQAATSTNGNQKAPEMPQAAPISQGKQPAKGKVDQPAVASKPSENSEYGQGSDPDPLLGGGDPFHREGGNND